MNSRSRSRTPLPLGLALLLGTLAILGSSASAIAQPPAAEPPPAEQGEPGAPPVTTATNEPASTAPAPPERSGPAPANDAPALDVTPPDPLARLDVWELLEAGGTIGWLIVALSIAFVALLLEHLLSVRTATLAPRGLAAEVHRHIGQGQFAPALSACEKRPSFLAAVLAAGLAEVELGYSAVEKAMEDAAQQQAARLYRKLEFFTMIGTIAPMLGLLGTVWGMIIAFMEFEVKANPAPSELAPGIYKALVTTLQGLCVAIPALAAYAILRNRTDELVAETSLAAEHAFSVYKRGGLKRKADPAPDPRRAVRRPETHDDRTGAGE